MSEDDRLDLLDSLSPDVLRLNPEHTISFLWNQQAKGDFDVIFDATMQPLPERTFDIFHRHLNNHRIPCLKK
jgi:type I restriction enzyme M protein